MQNNKSIRFHNTLSGKVEEFKPLQAGKVGLYTCGPTVYDYAHIGNFRAFVFEDLLRRFLESQNFKVRHVMNITDVDDKTIAGANQNVGAGLGPAQDSSSGRLEEPPLRRLQNFTAFYTQAFREDLQTLNILPPVEQPFATKEIRPILELIEKLVKKKIAYEKEGSVYYRVASFPNYGKLSKKKLDMNIQGARVDVDEYAKEEGADFALWKKAREGEPAWDSPWGKGRPGWHIECSAMSMKYLGETFDIHAGGEDLVFPHHENEIAQSEAATGKPFVKYWLHCKFLLVDGKKMSKKDKNFYTLRDLLAKGYDPMAIRYALLATHYRTPLNFTLEGLKEAGEIIRKLDDCYSQYFSVAQAPSFFEKWLAKQTDAESGLPQKLKESMQKILEALAEDLNISAALSWLFIALNEINSAFSHHLIGKENLKAVAAFFREIDDSFGLDIATVRDIPEAITKNLIRLQECRARKDFQVADGIRSELKSAGWLVKDGRPGEPSTVKKIRRAWDK